MPATPNDPQDANREKIAKALGDVPEALGNLVRSKIDEELEVATAARNDAKRSSKVEGVLSGILLTAGVAMGVAAVGALVPAVAMTAIGSGIVATMGVLLGVAAVRTKKEAEQLEGVVAELTAAREQANDDKLVVGIANEKLAGNLAAEPEKTNGKPWAERTAESAQSAGVKRV